MFAMKDEYKTGIEFVDEQHAMIFDIANRAYFLLKEEYRVDKYDDIINIIEELRSYSLFHFKAEEAYMERIGYKKRFTQKIEHMTFIDKIDNLDIVNIDLNQEDYIINILKFLNDWLVDHILEKDLLIEKQYVCRR